MRPSCTSRVWNSAAASATFEQALFSTKRPHKLGYLIIVSLALVIFLVLGQAGRAQSPSACYAGGACLYVGSPGAVTYWVLPQSFYVADAAFNGPVGTGWEIGLTFPGTDTFLSAGGVCGIARICDYDMFTLFPASLSNYNVVLAIAGPGAVCIVPFPAGAGTGCGSPPPPTCAQSSPPPPSPPTVQQLIGIAKDAWSPNPSGAPPYRAVQHSPSSDGKSFVTVYENGDPANGGQIVIAAAGDVSNLPINLFADSSFTTGHVSGALNRAVSNMAQVVQNYAQLYLQNQSPQSCPASITLTGYSLGGAIAQIVGNETNNSTVTFAAPGVGNLLSQFGITSSTTPGTDINYRLLGDQESLVGQRVGETITVMPEIIQTFFANLGNQTLGTIALTNWTAFSNIFMMHDMQWLAAALMNAPSKPGDFSGSWLFPKNGPLPGPPGLITASNTSVGIQYDISAITSLLTPLNVIGSQNANIQQFSSTIAGALLNGFDPPAGYFYSFVSNPGSPDFASIRLPVDGSLGLGGNVFGWTLNYRTDTGGSGTLTSVTGDFTLPQGVHSVDFYPINASGDPTLYDLGEFLVGATFGSNGTFNGTLTTYLTPLTNLPLTSGQSCNGTFNGTFNGAVTVSAGQNCMFTDICEIKGNVTINGGSFNLACVADGNVTENGGSLVLGPSAGVGGNVQISGASAFTLGPGAAIGGNLQIQGLPAGLSQGTVCSTQVKGNLQAQNNASPIQIGGTNAQSCTGNAVGGNLLVDANTAAVWIDYNTVAGALHVDNDSATTDVSGNSVGKNMECESNNTVTHVSPNMVSGQAQGQCAAFPQ
jgi:hypothetical protein